MSKAPGKKSILANFASFTPQQSDSGPGKDAGSIATSASRVAGVIGATQRTLTELREERDKLQALAEAGGLFELDPELVDPSPFPDRLNDDDDKTFHSFKELIAAEGQMIPILVRRHPSQEGRYQVAYGHRRLRAARELGVKVKAKIDELDDRQLIVAQGVENSARQDLTWAEKALFTAGMDAAGIKARDIRSALGVDDSELARFRAVCRDVTEDVIRTIGRAAKAGRTRWVALARACTEPGALDRVRETLAHAKVSNSDDRFILALNAAVATRKQVDEKVQISDSRGRKVGTASFKSGAVKIVVNRSTAPDFTEFLLDELPNLIEKYEATRRS